MIKVQVFFVQNLPTIRISTGLSAARRFDKNQVVEPDIRQANEQSR
jgi:hypothetical protein